MPKLYFRYGTMNSSKTANLLMTAHNFVSTNRKIFLIKPDIDIRNGYGVIYSRIIPSVKADYIIKKDTNDYPKIDPDVKCILVDESQFLTTNNIDWLRNLTVNFPVICYGLRTDYKSNLFEGSKRLMEVADSIEEVKTICSDCESKAIINAKKVGNRIIKDGSNEIDLGTEEKYIALCWECWNSKSV